MKTIIVATDFSPVAVNAANYAADMALAIHANLLLLHIYQIPVVYLEVPVANNEDEFIRDAEESILKLKDDLNRKTGNQLQIDTEVRTGIFFPDLKEVCERVQPFAVVTGSQGTTATDHFLLGTHAVFAMRNLMWPLITVPPGATFSAIRKIGFACDFSDVTDTAPVDEIKAIINQFHAELHIINTRKGEAFIPRVNAEAGMIQEMLGTLKPHYHFIINENIDQGIIDFTENNNIDLLIVSPKHHSLLDKIIHRSHTKKLVLHSHIPVAALHQ